MEIGEIIKYATHTPANINPAVLESMLEAIIGDGGGGTSGGALCAVYHSSIDYETVEGMPIFPRLHLLILRAALWHLKGSERMELWRAK